MGQVTIIGAGLAGLSAAITLAEQNIACDLVSLQPSERAQSILAAGGINAVLNTMGEEDTIEEHFQDTVRGGVDLADPNAIYGMVKRAPQIVEELYRMGVPFQAENDTLIQRNFGGQKKKRTAYSKSSTGKMLMSALIDEARKWESKGLIHRYPHHEFLDLIVDQDICTGCLIRDTYTGKTHLSEGNVILASGGINGIFGSFTTGTTQNTGDVTAAAFSHGVHMGNLEFIQYHPTTIAIPGKRMLISEAARGEGGRLFVRRNGVPWYFMEEKYPELGNLMPRDVISREMDQLKKDPACDPQVFLDLTCIPSDTWKKKLSDMREECLHYLHLDPVKEPIPVEPGIHYFMGGILVDIGHRTNLKHLYAAGECACQYHGANRLGGNSMLGAVYGGKTAAETAASELENILDQDRSSPCVKSGVNTDFGKLPAQGRSEGSESRESETGKSSDHPDLWLDQQSFAKEEEAMTASLMRGMAICRTAPQLKKELQVMDRLLQTDPISGRMKNRLCLAKAMLLCADHRKESRGAHFRLDYPDKNEAFHKTTVASFKKGEIRISLQEIPGLQAV